MTYRILYRAGAEKDLERIPDPFQSSIRKAVQSLAGDPRPQGSKKLVDAGNAYRIRVGKYRIGYLVLDRQIVITVVAIAERGKIYPLLKRRLR